MVFLESEEKEKKPEFIDQTTIYDDNDGWCQLKSITNWLEMK